MSRQTEGEVPLPLRHRNHGRVGSVGGIPPSLLRCCAVGSPHPPGLGALGLVGPSLWGWGAQPPLGGAEC